MSISEALQNIRNYKVSSKLRNKEKANRGYAEVYLQLCRLDIVEKGVEARSNGKKYIKVKEYNSGQLVDDIKYFLKNGNEVVEDTKLVWPCLGLHWVFIGVYELRIAV